MIRTQDFEAEFESQLKRISESSIREKVVETGTRQAKEAAGRVLKS
jgi:hypothetical protein